MADLAAFVEHGNLEPGVAPAVAGCPHDRVDALRPQIELRGGRPQLGGGDDLPGADLVVQAHDRRELVDLGQRGRHLLVGRPDDLGETVVEADPMTGRVGQLTGQTDSLFLQQPDVDRPVVGRAH